MKKKHFSISLICILLILSTFGMSACSNNKENNSQDIKYQKYEKSTINFNDNSKDLDTFDKSIYYINDLKTDMGDPFIVYDNGFYYAYGTRGGQSFHCFRSSNLQDWVRIGDCFVPENASWGKTDLWAPDIQKIGDKWYLYYTAKCVYADGSEHPQLGVAIADRPTGPFRQYTGINANGEKVTLADTPFKGLEKNTILDSTVFQDDNGELYMYFSYDTTKTTEEARNKYGIINTNSAEIYGVKMKDPVTWDLSTLKRLISVGYKNLSDTQRTIEWESWSETFSNDFECAEGPYMIKHNGKYFLTYCANSFADTVYNVGYAIGTSPLGEFEKPNDYELQNMLLGVPGAKGTYINTRYLGFMTGTGHASIFKAGDEYMFAYHAHTNRDVWGKEGTQNSTWRSLAIDYLYFDENGMPYTNGPTYSLQRLPEAVSGYKNIMSEATVRIDGEGANYLKDNRTNRAGGRLPNEQNNEAQFKAGVRSIEITFSSPKRIKAVNVYNSCDFKKRTEFIKQIDFGNGKGATNINFNPNYINYKQKFVNPHTAYNVLLNQEIITNRIVITFESTTDFAVGEIEILGRE